MNELSQEVLTFHAATLCLGLIVAIRFIARLSLGRVLAFLLMAVVVGISVNRLFSQLLFGSMDPTELPRWALIVINWLFASVVVLALLQVLLDVGTILRAIVTRRLKRPPANVRWLMGAAVLSLTAVGVAQALRLPPVATVEVAIKDLPPDLDGTRILQLSDLHISPLFPASWVAGVVAASNNLDPDLIVITGDLVDGQVAARRADVAPLRMLRAPLGVYMAPGNHEYYFDYPGWMEEFARLGIRPLANDQVVLRQQGADLVLAGVTDVAALPLGLPGPDLSRALAGAPAGAPVVLLDHQPRQAALAAAAGVDLQLSGHTHGGMILGFRRLVARLNSGFVSGLYVVDGMPLYVSNGTGLAPGFAVRLGVASELTVIVLRGT